MNYNKHSIFILDLYKFQRPKLNSVIGILVHLSGCHFAEIKKAMLDLLEVSKCCFLMCVDLIFPNKRD